MKEQIVITGSTGLIGSHLIKKLENKYRLVLLTRNPSRYSNTESTEYVYWDGKSPIAQILENSLAVINLIGENIGDKRWTAKQKSLILNSRKDAAIAISYSIKACKAKPKVWIQASATGLYGQESDIIFNESSPKAPKSFLADVCEAWEKPITELDAPDVRKVIVRTGVVLAQDSDLWKQLNKSFDLGIAAIAGNGWQHLPWIHIEDEVNAILFTLDNNECDGAFNLVAPFGATMKEVIEAIGSFRRNYISIHIPAWFLRIIFGTDKACELVLTNQHVTPEKLLEKRFLFKYGSIEEAVKDLIETKNQ